jgi:septal ring factor EnvC (AmiA/AmiB activator)
MQSIAMIHRRLGVALLVVGAVAVTAAVAGRAAPQADGPPGLAELSNQISQLSVQVTGVDRHVIELTGRVGALETRMGQLEADMSGVDGKVTQVNSRTIDISQDIQLLKQLSNSTHDRLTAVCRNVNHAWVTLYVHMGLEGFADEHNCWRNYYDPGYAATFSSRWTDPIP